MKQSIVGFLLIFVTTLFVMPVLAQNEGLVGYWMLNEGSGSVVKDSSDSGNDGTLNGDPEWSDGYYEGALEFDGIEDEVSVPYSASLNPEEFTACLWANVASGSSGHRAAISCRDDTPVGTTRGYIIYAEPGNTWQFWIGIGAGGAWNNLQGPAVTLDEWTHLAAVYSDGEQQFYVDGELAGESAGELNINTAQVLLIGAGANEGASHNFLFVGKLDDVRVYNRALTENEIVQAMSGEGAAVSTSGKIAATWGMLKEQ